MKRTGLVITLVLVVAAVGAASFLVMGRMRANAAAQKTKYRTAKAEVGTVKKTVSATGVLQPWTTVSVKSKAGGLVTAMMVDVGSVVKQGQRLATIDPSDTQLQVDQARADIESADARILQANETYTLQQQQSSLSVQQAQTQLGAAQASLEQAKSRLQTAQAQSQVQPSLTDASIASAQANLDSAQKQLAQLTDATNPQERAQAKAALDQAIANKNQADSNLARQQRLLEKGYVAQQVVDQAKASAEVADAQVAMAQQKMSTIQAEQDAAVQTQRARVRQADAQLKDAQAGKVDILVRQRSAEEARAAVRQQQKAVETAQKALALARANVRNNDIRAADIASAKATRFRADAGYKNAAKTLAQTIVTAPCAGVVIKKSVEQGTIISSALSFAATGNDILTLADTTRMYVDVTVDETDIANVQEGQNVDVSFDAYRDVPYEGKVIRVDPQAVVEQNVTNIHVRVELDNSDAKFQLLKPGMNATCEFVRDRKEGVLCVQNEAIHSDDSGSFVEVVTGGVQAPPDPKTGEPSDPTTLVDCKVDRRPVNTKGEALVGNETTEITDGLKEGETVVIQKIEPVAQTTGAIGGFGGPRGGGRGR